MDSHDYLWMDKYQPRTLADLTFNPNVTEILKSLSQKEDFPHLIFYGPDGAGKKTRIHAFLEQIYGSGIRKVVTTTKEWKNNSTVIEYSITSSMYHIELSPSESDNHDRIIIQKVIKETSSVSQLDSKAQKKFKVIVLLEVDNLTKDAQAALRRTMEKYSKNCRLIMSCNSLSKIIPPIRSRCLSLRVACPEENELKSVWNRIKMNEMVNVTENQIGLIVRNSNLNVRIAINSLQMTTLDSYGNDVYVPEYLQAIKSMCRSIAKDQTVEQVKKSRDVLFKLIVNGVQSDEIIINMTKYFVLELWKNERKCQEIIHAAAMYDNRAQNGSKSIFHLEALIAKIMHILVLP